MRLKSQMQKADILTIDNELLQTQYNGVVFQDRNMQFEELKFAGDAKQIFEAVSLLDNAFFFIKEQGNLKLSDSFQEFNIKEEVADKILTPPIDYKMGYSDGLCALRPFVTQDFPAYFMRKDYTEVIHPSMIVRSLAEYGNGAYSVCDLPKQAIRYISTDEGFWVSIGNDAYICMGKLDVVKPDTDGYFTSKEGPTCLLIPEIIKERWISCTWVEFTSEGLVLDDRIVIEGIKGFGKYDGKLFGKVIRNAKYWKQKDNLMYFENDYIHGVLENVGH